MATKAQSAPTDAGTGTWWPSQYGADDRVGALNEITPANVLEAVRPVRQGRVYDLAQVEPFVVPQTLNVRHGTRPARSGADTPAPPHEAPEQAAAGTGPRPWRHGTWRDPEWSAEDRAALTRLDHALIRRTGGARAALNLPGWERASIWAWDPPGANYFAVLWRNPATGPRRGEPDIWINGWENIGGELYRVTTTHVLAMEISLATGRPLPEVCAALGADGPRW